MGSMNPDRVPLAYRRRRCETVRQMIDQGWDVHARCHAGHLLRVDLRVIAVVRGPDFSLWNKKARCRIVGCTAFVDFQAKAPGMTCHQKLEAPWPDGTPPAPLKR